MTDANPELQLAGAFVRETGCHLFLTGRAGTGKTTFLQALKNESPKRLIVTAPTGVAAINAGGVTLHAFFQLPFGPFVPGAGTTRAPYRFSREKIDLMRNLDLLVIDEVSMVRADLLDGVDAVLRRFRNADRPFGGVQLLMIGDLFQLPPVVKDEEWQILKPIYATPYFFSSTALRQTEMVAIELQHIYRQVDDRFIDLLNRVRNGRLDAATLQALNQRHIPGYVPAAGEAAITLCTHNRSADAINLARLDALPRPAHTFAAEVEGDFPEHTHPTAAALTLKTGAQVMFVRNDPSPEKRYFNGKIGTVTRIAGREIRIRCPEDAADIVVEPVTWENIAYTLNRETQEIQQTRIGAFTQMPLRLAWAITIHKSQGLTFDRAVIDAQAAFAHGQVYVALSRCRTLEGMVLSTPLTATAVSTDPEVRRFSEAVRQHAPTMEALQAARVSYQQRLLLECFDFGRLRRRLRRLVALLLGNPEAVHVSGGVDVRELQQRIEAEICTIGDRFQRQLQAMFAADSMPAGDAAVLARIAKASAYFREALASGPAGALAALSVDSDNQAVLRKVNQARKQVGEELAAKLAAVSSCARGFSADRYHRALSAAVTESKPTPAEPGKAVYTESDIAHPELFEILKAWRSRKAAAEGIPHYRILHQKSLIHIAVDLPDNLTALKRIRGIGKQLAARYGEELVAIVADYRRQHPVEAAARPDPPSGAHPPPAAPAVRVDTKRATLELFEKGLNLAQIADQRGLAASTIAGHLAHFVETGVVAIERLVPTEKRRTIEAALSRAPHAPLRDIKQSLGADVSYAEIRLVQAHVKGRATPAAG